MGGSGSFPIDLILFGMIAAFLVLRLRSILGRRQGFERPAEPPRPEAVARSNVTDIRGGPVIDARAEPAAPVRALPEPSSPLGLTLARMAQVDRNFEASRFLGGAEAAFRLIVTAFAAGDRVALRPLLSDDTYAAFETAIAGRETAGETQRTEVRAINTAALESGELRGNVASLSVRFVSDQVNVTLGHDGNPVAGADAVTEIVDLWTFERDLTAADPTWRLVAARSA